MAPSLPTLCPILGLCSRCFVVTRAHISRPRFRFCGGPLPKVLLACHHPGLFVLLVRSGSHPSRLYQIHSPVRFRSPVFCVFLSNISLLTRSSSPCCSSCRALLCLPVSVFVFQLIIASTVFHRARSSGWSAANTQARRRPENMGSALRPPQMTIVTDHLEHRFLEFLVTWRFLCVSTRGNRLLVGEKPPPGIRQGLVPGTEENKDQKGRTRQWHWYKREETAPSGGWVGG